MQLSINDAWAHNLLLCAARIAPLFLMSPLFSLAQLPVRIRWLLILVFSAACVALKANVAPLAGASISLWVALLGEVLLGAVLAFGIYCVFGAFLFGGRILDLQMGFGVANLVDPSTRQQAPLLGTALNVMAVMTFYLLDSHHLLIRALLYTFDVVPLGSGWQPDNLAPIANVFGLMFVFGLMLVSPVVFTLLLIDAAMAVAARTMPQMNMFMLGIPVKIAVGIVVLACSLFYMSGLLKKIYAALFDYWMAVL